MTDFKRNNPLNIRYSERNNWVGQIGQENGFCVFKAPEYGIRAAFKILKNYARSGFCTIDAIINRWAPPCENPTKQYRQFVVKVFKRLGYFDTGEGVHDMVLDMRNDRIVLDLIYAMCLFETGLNPQYKEIEALFRKAGLLDWKDEPFGLIPIN